MSIGYIDLWTANTVPEIGFDSKYDAKDFQKPIWKILSNSAAQKRDQMRKLKLTCSHLWTRSTLLQFPDAIEERNECDKSDDIEG